MPVAKRRTAADSREYLVDGVEDREDDLFEDDDEDARPARSSSLQSGWEAALNASKADSKKYTNEFRFSDEQQLVKFISSEPFAVFGQHWIERQGKRSFVCLAEDPQGCPLCDKGDTPRTKVAFSIVNLSAEEPVVEMLLTSPTLTRQLANLAEDPKTGPLDRIYYALSRSGTGPKTVYQVTPVKPRDLEEDWSVSQSEIESLVDTFEPLTAQVISFTPRAELMEIAREVTR